MPVAPTYPGVYIEEIPSGVRTIAGVGTSVALFVGRAAQGSLKKPTLCLSYADFVRAYSEDARFGELPRSVRLFFENGGTSCWVMRIAHGAEQSAVTLRSEAGAPVLKLTAKSPGLLGDTIRAAITYSGPRPEATFNIELFRWEKDGTGNLVKRDSELWSNLSMDPQSRRFAPTYITQNSKLVDAEATATLTAGVGYSQSGRPIDLVGVADTDVAFLELWARARGGDPDANPVVPAKTQFRIGVGGMSPVTVDLSGTEGASGANTAARTASLVGAIQQAINDKLPAGTQVTVSLESGPEVGGNARSVLRIAAPADVVIQPAEDPASDAAIPLMLGEAQGGLEISAFAGYRPAPTGVTHKTTSSAALWNFAETQQQAINTLVIGGKSVPLGSLVTTGTATDPMFEDGLAPQLSKTGNNDGVREKLALITSRFNANAPAAGAPFRAELWGLRLALLPTEGADNVVPATTTATTNLGADFNANVRYARLGAGGAGFQQDGVAGDDGDPPDADDYRDAYAIVDKEIDLFNLLVLPADVDSATPDRRTLWGPASTFCASRRALLLMDAPDLWTSMADAIDPASGVNSLRVGLVKTNAALFFPALVVNEGGLNVKVSASGAIAGLMARIDATRGVWKAPAGMEADLRGVVGLAQRFSDGENGFLNPRAINTLRAFPFGIVNWGARTMDGDDGFGSEWKYVPVRRLALFLEESLYRGTQWAVFEPNDEPLWAQIRLNIGAFMQSLFRQGAFQGKSPREAYFVKCDRDTTTQDDVNRGIVNVVVGFAPLKPAEFVIIKIQQMAGQLSA